MISCSSAREPVIFLHPNQTNLISSSICACVRAVVRRAASSSRVDVSATHNARAPLFTLCCAVCELLELLDLFTIWCESGKEPGRPPALFVPRVHDLGSLPDFIAHFTVNLALLKLARVAH
ncbi:hypothetical protein RRG08_001047 [Elysia crispata]|uniref:Uncharacterized protein n=1 Tax=Elysia crispata TaxID=231223 RepID=A0AAE1AWE1_9GAST|nr:hypothetical protein RRG08_001047 [Elysia crispata]